MPGSEIFLAAGMDEVGRGCLAGPVVAAIVMLRPGVVIGGLADSKKLTPERRGELDLKIKETTLAWAVGRAEPCEIDQINILQASLLAMRRAFDALAVFPEWVRVDGTDIRNSPATERLSSEAI